MTGVMRPVIVTFVLRMILTVQSDDAFNQRMLELHNEYRELHNSPPLELNEDLCRVALELATKLSNGENVENTEPYGENAFTNFNPTPQLSDDEEASPENVFFGWYRQEKHYDYSLSTIRERDIEPEPFIDAVTSNRFKTINFIQIVWKQINKIGVGKASNGGLTAVVVLYDPPVLANGSMDYVINIEPPKRKRRGRNH